MIDEDKIIKLLNNAAELDSLQWEYHLFPRTIADAIVKKGIGTILRIVEKADVHPWIIHMASDYENVDLTQWALVQTQPEFCDENGEDRLSRLLRKFGPPEDGL